MILDTHALEWMFMQQSPETCADLPALRADVNKFRDGAGVGR